MTTMKEKAGCLTWPFLWAEISKVANEWQFLLDKEKGATVFLRNPSFFLVSPVGIEPTTY